MSNIASIGSYIPHYSVGDKILSPKTRKNGKRAVAYVDEDIITMAYEAAVNCFNRCAANKSGVNTDAIFFATTSPVFRNRYHASFLAGLLNLPKEITALDFGSTPRAGTDALLLASHLADAGIYKNILVVCSELDFPGIGEEEKKPSGHAACAFLIGNADSKNFIAKITSVHSFSSDIAEEFIYKNQNISFDPRFSRDSGFKTNVKSALGKIKINPGDFDAVILNSLFSKLAGGIFFKAGFSESQFAKDSISSSTGNTGCCHGLLQLINSIENKKKKILVFDYFNGTNVISVDADADFSALPPTPDDNKKNIESYQEYLRIRKIGNFNSIKYKTEEMFSSEMMNEREKENAIYLNGFECTECKTVYFIKSARCKKCKCEKFSLKKLQNSGTVYTSTKEFYFPHSFPPITMAVIDLDGGGRITVQMTDDMYPEEKNKVEIGSKVKLVLRKMMEKGTKPDYFWKGKKK